MIKVVCLLFACCFGLSQDCGVLSAQGRPPGLFRGFAAQDGQSLLVAENFLFHAGSSWDLWTQEPQLQTVTRLKWCQDRFVVWGNGNEAPYLAYSLDGSAWQKLEFDPAVVPFYPVDWDWDGLEYHVSDSSGRVFRISAQGEVEQVVQSSLNAEMLLSSHNGSAIAANVGEIWVRVPGGSWTKQYDVDEYFDVTLVRWVNDRFWVVTKDHTQEGRIHTSTDGINWETQNNESGIELLAFKDQSWLAMTGQKVLSSEDGNRWTELALQGIDDSDLYRQSDLVADAEWFYTWADDNLYRSQDGKNWESVTKETGQDFAIFRQASGVDATVYLTNQGVKSLAHGDGSWQDIPGYQEVEDLVWAGDRFFMCGQHELYSSEDGREWEIASQDYVQPNRLVWADTALFGVASGILFKFDMAEGIWRRTHPWNGTVSALSWDGNQLLALVHQQLYVSKDLQTWSSPGGWECPAPDLISFNGHTLSLGSGAFYSEDNQSWISLGNVESGLRAMENVITTDEGFFGLVGGEIVHSRDGKNWTSLIKLQNISIFSGFGFDPVEKRLILAETRPEYHQFSLDISACLMAKEQLTALIPWVVNNDQWLSRVIITNTNTHEASVRLQAVTQDGETDDLSIVIPESGVYAATARALFPNLSGYSLFLYSVERNLFPSYLSFNLEPESGGASPSQAEGSLITDLTKLAQFGYLPEKEMVGLVLVAPELGSEEQMPVRLSLVNNGEVLGIQTVLLSGQRPQAFLLSDLFSGIPTGSMLDADAGIKLAGTIFVFNQSRQPSMARAFSLPFRIIPN